MNHSFLPLLNFKLVSRISRCCLSHGTNYYQVLGVSPDSTRAQIKESFYQLSLIHHPDKNPGAESATKFQDISEAYEILSNYKTRKQYDRGLIHPQSHSSANRNQTYVDPVHYSFYKQRIVKQTIMKSQSKIYDFDEFYRQHYSMRIRKDQELQGKAKRMIRVSKDVKNGKFEILSYLLFSLVMIASTILMNMSHGDSITRKTD